MALLGNGIIISGGATSMSDLDEIMIFSSVLLSTGGIIISGAATSPEDLDEIAVFSSVSPASSKKVTLSPHKTIESITYTKDFSKTGV